MYLAYKIVNKQKHYFIRKSVFLDGDYVSRELMELGLTLQHTWSTPEGEVFISMNRWRKPWKARALPLIMIFWKKYSGLL